MTRQRKRADSKGGSVLAVHVVGVLLTCSVVLAVDGGDTLLCERRGCVRSVGEMQEVGASGEWRQRSDEAYHKHTLLRLRCCETVPLHVNL